MSPLPFLEVDVRPLVAARQPPIGAIMDAVDLLAPGQALRLIAPFEPVPLYAMLARQGFRHTTKRREDDAWEILFER
ncbi:hypothetical protein ASA1KI_35360 [Opitutales bacterium ASA1]|uniref:DUF2249 domain-containing protein n=1 Tax=Congregicoccus parvus TaxID=3081749 RepID=UPI002B32122C|nr:hypothetical protein ASA1KI_35360 [Opitutales bacterium ASA1]